MVSWFGQFGDSIVWGDLINLNIENKIVYKEYRKNAKNIGDWQFINILIENSDFLIFKSDVCSGVMEKEINNDLMKRKFFLFVAAYTKKGTQFIYISSIQDQKPLSSIYFYGR